MTNTWTLPVNEKKQHDGRGNLNCGWFTQNDPQEPGESAWGILNRLL